MPQYMIEYKSRIYQAYPKLQLACQKQNYGRSLINRKMLYVDK